MKDNSLFFMIISLACVWLVLDEFYGHNYISQFVVKMIPKAESESETDGGMFDLFGATSGSSDEHKVTEKVNGEDKNFYWDGNKYVSKDGMILQ